MKKLKVLVVGQTPPPYHGQAIMIQRLLSGHYNSVELYHVRMAFSRSIEEIGKIKFYKVLELLKVIINITRSTIRHHPDILLYHPGANLWSVLRDIVILISTKWMFPKVVLAFRAGGLGDFYRKASPFLRFVMRLVYFNPDAAIHLSDFSPPDGQTIRARRIFVVPNGLEDVFQEYTSYYVKNSPPVILFIGALYRSKGIFDLLEAVRILKLKGLEFQVRVIGDGPTQVVELVNKMIAEYHLENFVSLAGIKTGKEKWKELAAGDIFCFPTYYEFENLSVAVLEAMMFSLPIVATNWRGNSFMVRDGENGFLVPIRSTGILAEKLKLLIEDPDLRSRMGTKSRERFLEQFTIDRFYKEMEKVFILTGFGE